MSTIPGRGIGNISVIVRGFGNRPVRLMGRVADGQVQVFRNDPAKSLTWPQADVFCDDPATYSRLESAWKAGNQQAIKEAWNHAQPFTQLNH